MRDDARVVIIGGGAMGAGLAYFLAHEGWTDTVLIEKGELSSGSTWHAAGLIPHFIASLNMAKCHAVAPELYASLEEETGLSGGWHNTGAIRLAVNQDQVDWFKDVQGMLDIVGVRSELIPPERILDYWPFMDVSDVKLGFYTPDDGWSDPSSATAAMVKGARQLGCDVENLLISQPDAGEQALEIADTLVRSGAIDVLVVDSVAALTPRAELEGEMGDSHVGLQARLMSQALRKLTGSISRSRTMVIFINQIRMKIGVMYGSPETTTGGNALKFYASVRLDIRRTGAIKDRDEIVGNQTRVKVVKNKLAPPFKVIEFDIMYGEGISKTGELIDLGTKAGIVEKSGSWYSYDSTRIGQGRENAKQFLRENDDLATEIEASLRRELGLPPLTPAPVEEAPVPEPVEA